MKKIIGILPNMNLYQTNDIFDDRFYFIENYMKRIKEVGGLSYGILSIDDLSLYESLDICDAILICGGKKIYSYHFRAIEYAIKNNKKLLGICLGMQVIHTYFIVLDEAQKREYTGDLVDLYEQMKKEKYNFVMPIEGHWDVHIERGKEEEAKHNIRINNDSQLYKLLKQENFMAASMHKYRISYPSSRLNITGYSDDGTIESIEFGDNIIGVQFHPEVDDKLNELFKFLVE